jgi:hypothetical protein
MCIPWLEDALCGCSGVVEEEPLPSNHTLSTCYVYPCYDHQPQPPIAGETATEAEAEAELNTERAAHEYLVRMHRLPASLPQAGAAAPRIDNDDDELL